MLSLKKHERTEREITTPLFLLLCLEVGLGISDLDLLTIGMVLDIWAEKGNDSVKYKAVDNVRLANQRDFDLY